MPYPFSLPGVSYIGQGSLNNLEDEIRNRRTKKVFIVSDRAVENAGIVGRVHGIVEKSGVMEVHCYLDTEREPGIGSVDRAAAQFKKFQCDHIIGVGGGSCLDMAKGISVLATNKGSISDYIGENLVQKPGIDMTLIPTTSGTGSEVTRNAIFTDYSESVKKGVVSPFLLPQIAIVDPDLTVSVPSNITAITGMDALTHAIESYVAQKSTIHTDLYARKAIKIIKENLVIATNNGSDLKARENMAYGSFFAGISLGNAGVGAVHALAYPLGGKYGVSHGLSNAVLLPYVMEYNYSANIEKFADIAVELGGNPEGKTSEELAESSVRIVKELIMELGLPNNIAGLGINEEDIPALAEPASKISRLLRNNPKELSVSDIKNIYLRAYHGGASC